MWRRQRKTFTKVALVTVYFQEHPSRFHPVDRKSFMTQNTTHGCVALYSRDNTRFNEWYVPRQLTPSPEYPLRQVQLYEPKVLLH